MKYSTATLKIHGYRDQPVPNTFRHQGGAAQHLAVILPGRGYSGDMPLLYYANELLLAHGADVLTVEYDYFGNADFRDVSEAERSLWIGADVTAALTAGLKQHPYTRVTLIGKSLGTLAMGHLLTSEPALQAAEAVWLTPLLGSDTLREQIARWGGRSLFVVGTADETWQPQDLAEVQQASGGAMSLTLQDADHSLEVGLDTWRSLDYLTQVMRALDQFLNSPA